MDRRIRTVGIILCGLLCAAGQSSGGEQTSEVSAILRTWSEVGQQRGREGMMVRALQQFVGPLREDSLQQRFHWTLTGAQELTAEPVENTERPFIPRIQIEIDAEGLPTQVTVGQLTRDVRALVRAELVAQEVRDKSASSSGIVTVSFEEPAPAAKTIDPRIQQILCCWTTASQKAQAVRTTFQRVDYDLATEVESHCTGEFTYSAPRLGYYRTVPTLRPAKASARIGIHGTPFVQLPGVPSQILWTDKELFQIESASQSYFAYTLPKTGRDGLGIGSFDNLWRRLMTPQNCLPFVVALHEKELRESFDWKLIQDARTGVILEATPIAGPDQAHFYKIQVVVNPATWRTQATRITDISRTQETTHQFFDQIVSNTAADLGQWTPDLTGLTRANPVNTLANVPPVEPAGIEPASAEIEGR